MHPNQDTACVSTPLPPRAEPSTHLRARAGEEERLAGEEKGGEKEEEPEGGKSSCHRVLGLGDVRLQREPPKILPDPRPYF